MKFAVPTLLATFVLASQSARASFLVAGWHQFDGTINSENAEDIRSGYSGVVAKDRTSASSGGSNDGFYGNSAEAVPTEVDGHLQMSRISPSNIQKSTFALTNGSAGMASLTSLLFDAAGVAAGAMVSVSYQLGIGPVIALGSFSPLVTAGTATHTDFSDFSIDLVAAGGPALLAGQTILFNFAASSGTIRLDNVAVMGIPEPGSMVALAGILAAGLTLRSRRRQTPVALA